MSRGFRVTNPVRGQRELQPGNPGITNAISDFFVYEAAQVISVVQNERSPQNDPENQDATSNTGRIRVRFVNGDADVGGDLARNLKSALGFASPVTEQLNETNADPLIPHQTIFPLVGEYVLVFKVMSTYWYIGPINLKRKITENAYPIRTQAPAIKEDFKQKTQRLIREGVTTRLLAPSQRSKIAGTDFIENKANPLKQFEGDIVYQGRFGQSIRFGSSKMTPLSSDEQFPNILMRVGQSPFAKLSTDSAGGSALALEQLDTDASSIYMTSKQILKFAPATFGSNMFLASMFEKPTWDGAQIIINSDKVAINSKETSIYLFAKKGVHINALDDGVTIDSGGSIFLNTPSDMELLAEGQLEILGKSDITISAKKDINISGGRNVTFYGNEIFLGGRSLKASPIVLGKPLKMFLFEMLRVMMSNPAMIGAGAPNPVYLARLLILFCKYMVFPDPFNPLFNSNDNFAMRTNEVSMKSTLPVNRGFKKDSGTPGTNVPESRAFADSLQREFKLPGL